MGYSCFFKCTEDLNIFSGFQSYSLHNLLLSFDLVSNQNHEALEDCQDLWALVRSAKPARSRGVGWYFHFLYDAFKPTSFFLEPPVALAHARQEAPKPIPVSFAPYPMAGGVRALVYIQVGNVTVQFPHCSFSTGSCLSTIGMHDLQMLGIRSISNIPTKFKATDVTGHEVPFRGFFEAEVTFRGRKANVKFYVQTNLVDSPCLGIKAITDLKCSIGSQVY